MNAAISSMRTNYLLDNNFAFKTNFYICSTLINSLYPKAPAISAGAFYFIHCISNDYAKLFDTIKYPEALYGFMIPFKSKAVINTEDQSLYAEIELGIVVVVVFAQVVDADDLIQLQTP